MRVIIPGECCQVRSHGSLVYFPDTGLSPVMFAVYLTPKFTLSLQQCWHSKCWVLHHFSRLLAILAVPMRALSVHH